MNYQSDWENGTFSVFLNGELDHHAVKNLMTDLGAAIDAQLPHECVLDMKNVAFMDSSGLALMLFMHKRLSEIGGTLSVTNTGNQVRKITDAAGLGRLISII